MPKRPALPALLRCLVTAALVAAGPVASRAQSPGAPADDLRAASTPPEERITSEMIRAALDTLEVSRRAVALAAFAGDPGTMRSSGEYALRAVTTLDHAARRAPGRLRELPWPAREAWLELALADHRRVWSENLLRALGEELPPPGSPSRGSASLAVALTALRLRDEAPAADPARPALEARSRAALLAAAGTDFPLRDEALYRLWAADLAGGDSTAALAWADSLVAVTPRSRRAPTVRLTRMQHELSEGRAAEAEAEIALILPHGDSAEFRWEVARTHRALGRVRETAHDLEHLIGAHGADRLATKAFHLRLEMGRGNEDLLVTPAHEVQLLRWLLPNAQSGAEARLRALASADTVEAAVRAEAGIILARHLYAVRRYEDAEPELHRLLENEDAEIADEARLILARILRNTGRVDSMESHYRILIDRGGVNGGKAAWELGREFESILRWDAAVEAYSLYLERFPGYRRVPDVRFRRGFARIRRGDPEGAEEDFRAAYGLARRPEDQERAAFWLARTLEGLDRPGEAAEAARGGAWRTRPADHYGVLLRERYGLLLEPPPRPEGVPVTAHQTLPELVRERGWPEPLEAHFLRGLALAELGLRSRAGLEWSRAADLGKRDVDVLRALAYAATVHHVYPGAVRWARKAGEMLGVDSPLRAGYDRYGYPPVHYEDVIRASGTRGVSPEMVWAIVRQESFYDPGAVSRAGARGLMQIMPSTLERIEREQGWEPEGADALFRPSFNIRLGVGFFADRLDEFDRQPLPALASYNAGEGKARQWRDAADGDTGEMFLESIGYPETYDYVRRVMWLAWVYRSYYRGG